MTPGRAGSALIIVLLLISLLVVLTLEITMRGATDARMLENELTDVQAQYGLQGALVHAIALVKADLRADQKEMTERALPMADWDGEPWARPVTDQPLGDGAYGFTITDEQARYHLNALVAPDGTLAPAEQDRFARLLSACSPGADTAAFRQAVGDWVDLDTDGPYETGAPNRAFLTTKELLMVPMATTEVLLGPDGRSGALTRLTRWTTGQVNVNTAPREVLYAVSSLFDDAVFDRLRQARPLRSLDDLRPILQIPPLDPIPPDLASALSVRSTFFRVAMTYTKGSATRRATAIIMKVDGQPSRLWWDSDPYFP